IYQPAGGDIRVGGDWYDAFDLDDGRIGLVVGDVAGHGLAAAGLMAQLRNALRAYALAGMTPAEVMTAVGHLMHKTDASGFATCLYAVADPASGELVWARAGHPPMALHHGNRTRFLGELNDPPLGAIRDTTYSQTRAELRAEDVLV